MAATRAEIEAWLNRLYRTREEALAEGKFDDVNAGIYSHMIVICDDFDWEDFPVYVKEGDDVREVEAEWKEKSGYRVMEVYSKNHTKEEQMAERRAFHYD